MNHIFALPNELLDPVVCNLNVKDLLNLRLTHTNFNSLCASKAVEVFNYKAPKPKHNELINGYGHFIKCFQIEAPINKDKLLQWLELCPNLKSIQFTEVDPDVETIEYISSKLPKVKQISIELKGKGQFTPDHAIFSSLSQLRNLKVLHLNYVDYKVATELFYSFPKLVDFKAKLISSGSRDDVDKPLSAKPLCTKLGFKHIHLRKFVIESWINFTKPEDFISLDTELFSITPQSMPILENLSIKIYSINASQNWSFFNYKGWDNLTELELDVIKSTDTINEPELIVDNFPRLSKLKCKLFKSDGKALNRILYFLPIKCLKIENSISVNTLNELEPCYFVEELQLSLPGFNYEHLKMLNTLFPNLTTFHMAHIREVTKIDKGTVFPWKNLYVFQLNEVLIDIVENCPNLYSLVYDIIPNKTGNGLRAPKASPLANFKVLFPDISISKANF